MNKLLAGVLAVLLPLVVLSGEGKDIRAVVAADSG
jgi:thiosulfate reductase cytochrome b subunit